jgi:hypothetical protein
MPLYHGKKNIGRNIETLVSEGRPLDQSKAIALRKAGVPRKAPQKKKK